jgi:hypothetical protein
VVVALSHSISTPIPIAISTTAHLVIHISGLLLADYLLLIQSRHCYMMLRHNCLELTLTIAIMAE